MREGSILRELQQVICDVSVNPGSQEFVASDIGCNHNWNLAPLQLHMEGPVAALQTGDGLWFGEAEKFSVGVPPGNFLEVSGTIGIAD